MSLNHTFNLHVKEAHQLASLWVFEAPCRPRLHQTPDAFPAFSSLYSGGKNKVFQPHYARLSSHAGGHLLNMYSLFLPASEDHCYSAFSSTTPNLTCSDPPALLSRRVFCCTPFRRSNGTGTTPSLRTGSICIHDSFMAPAPLGFLADAYGESPLTAEGLSSGPRRAGTWLPGRHPFFDMYISWSLPLLPPD